MFPDVKPAPEILPSKIATPLPAPIRFASKYPLFPADQPDPAFVISNDVTAPLETMTSDNVPFHVESF